MKPKRFPRPSAYLWGRCEGWVRIGVFHSMIIDPTQSAALPVESEIRITPTRNR